MKGDRAVAAMEALGSLIGEHILGYLDVYMMHAFKALNPPFKKTYKKYLYYSLRFLE